MSVICVHIAIDHDYEQSDQFGDPMNDVDGESGI